MAAELGAEAKTFESTDPTTQRQNLEAAAKDAKVVVVIGFEFNDMLPEVAAAHPDVKFLQIDSCPFDKMQPNIFCSVFREYEASFLVGAEAALTSKTGKVGAIGALDIPFLHRYTDGFIKGAQHVKADIADLADALGRRQQSVLRSGARRAARSGDGRRQRRPRARRRRRLERRHFRGDAGLRGRATPSAST